MSVTSSGTSTVASSWDRYAMAYQNALRLPTDVVSYGPDAGSETDHRLLGPVNGKRIIDLGCGGGQACIALAKQGATAIGVDISVEQLAYARRLIEEAEVRVELRHGDLAELAFQRADSVDVAFSAFSLQYVGDLSRVFRQVHRVLKTNGSFVFSLPHPMTGTTGQSSTIQRKSAQLALETQPVTLERSYFDDTPIFTSWEHVEFVEYARPVSELFMGLIRTGFRVDVIAEPEPQDGSPIPRVLIMRARKEA